MIDIIYDIETTGLSPIKTEKDDEARISMIGLKTKDEEIIFTDEDEAKILNDFFNFLRKFKNFRLISFNGLVFDNQFIIVRSFKHKIKMIDFRYKSIDLRFVLANGSKFSKGRLEDYSLLIHGDPKFKGLKGDAVIKLWEDKNIETLKKYLLQDVRITYNIYERLKEIGLILPLA